MRSIYSVSAPAGAGKTHALTRLAVDQAIRHEKVLIAQPTTQLLAQTAAAIRNLDSSVPVTSIVATPQQPQPVRRIHEHIEIAAPNHGEVLLITHEALKRINKANRKFWHVVVDEIPSVFEHFPLKIGETHSLVTPYLKAEEFTPALYHLTVADQAAVERLMANPKADQNIATFQELLAAICNPDKLVLVSADSYTNLIDDPATAGHIDFFAILRDTVLDGFASATIMGANADETELVVLWSRLMGVQFPDHPILSGALRYTTHGNGARLSLYHLFDAGWSKRHANSGEDENTVIEQVRRFILTHMGGEPFLWQANTEHGDAFFHPDYRLPSVAHGLNRPTFNQCDNVVLLSALNRQPAAYKFLSQIGLDNATAHRMLSYQNDYQAMMRCSLREPAAAAPVKVIVTSRGAAEWLEGKFPGCTVQKLETGIPERKPVGRPAKVRKLTPAEKQKRYRERKKAQALAGQK